MLEPISSVSNLVFILFGILIFKRSQYVGLITIFLGIGSAGWHWAHSPFWHTFDLSMMYFMLIGLIDYTMGSKYTETALIAGIGVLGLHFVLPSHLIISLIAAGLFIALLKHYPPGRIFIITGCFALWITTNIPYLHQWEMAFWKIDLLHGFSHICAAIGIYKVISYKPVTFQELTKAFKTKHLSNLSDAIKEEFERFIDHELNPVFGKLAVEKIKAQDVSQLIRTHKSNEDYPKMTDGLEQFVHQIFEFAAGRGIRHNLIPQRVQISK